MLCHAILGELYRCIISKFYREFHGKLHRYLIIRLTQNILDIFPGVSRSIVSISSQASQDKLYRHFVWRLTGIVSVF